MALLLEMPSTANEALARIAAPVPDDSEFMAVALPSYLSGGSLGVTTARRLFRDFEQMEPEELQMEKRSAWRNLQQQICKLCMLDHMDDRLKLVQTLKETPNPEMEAHYRELFREQIADAKTEFLLLVTASITTKPLPGRRD